MTAGHADLAGQNLGGYRVLRRLGAGAMADVYLAEQRSLKRPVALKILRPNLAADEVYVKRFHQEAQAAALLVHPNIIQIYEIGALGGVHFIAQEYVDGGSLANVVSKRGRCDSKFVLALLRQVASALAKAAEHGVVHRDIKPENILISRDGQAKVADFGLARVVTGPHAAGLTQTGFTMGTPLYMSPEQVEGKSLDARSDMYSLGVTCYHLLAGRPPFEADTAVAVALQHVQNEPKRLDNLREGLPPELCDTVHRLLAKRPDDRYASPRELLAHLRQMTGPATGESMAVAVPEVADTDLAAAHRAATERLSVLMRTRPSEARTRKALMLLGAGALLLAFVSGLALSRVLREAPLLPAANQSLPAAAAK